MFLWKAFILTAQSFVIAHAILLYGAILAIKLSVIPVGAAIFCFDGFLFLRFDRLETFHDGYLHCATLI